MFKTLFLAKVPCTLLKNVSILVKTEIKNTFWPDCSNIGQYVRRARLKLPQTFISVYFSLHFSIKPIKEYPLNSYTSIGCYKSGDNHAVFSELGLTQAQCENAVLSYFGKNLKCELSYPKYSITSLTSLTIDICLQICTDNGFIYAGLI